MIGGIKTNLLYLYLQVKVEILNFYITFGSKSYYNVGRE